MLLHGGKFPVRGNVGHQLRVLDRGRCMAALEGLECVYRQEMRHNPYAAM